MTLLKTIQFSSETSESSGSLVFAGDTCTMHTPELEKLNAPDIFSDELLKLLGDGDYCIANVEAPLTMKSNPIKKAGPNISSHPVTAHILKEAGVNVGVIANNHILDHGQEGLADTIAYCRKNRIDTVGTGGTIDEAYKPLYCKISGQSVAILAFAEREFSIAGQDSGGAAEFFLPRVYTAIQKSRSECDVLIVCVHGGTMYFPVPNPNIQQYYRFIVDAGADAVIGSHPHAVQGVEVYKNTPIFYSLGTFLFPMKNRPKCWHEGLVAKLVLIDKKIQSLEIYPCRQGGTVEHPRIELLSSEESEAYSLEFDRLCEIVSDAQLVREFWRSFCKQKSGVYLNKLRACSFGLNSSSFLFVIKRAIKTRDISYIGLLLGEIFSRLKSKSLREKDKLAILSLLTCPGHRDVYAEFLYNEIYGISDSIEVDKEVRAMLDKCTV